MHGTKACPHYQLEVPGGESRVIRLVLTQASPKPWHEIEKSFAKVMETRQNEADKFYASLTPKGVNEDAARVMRQALAGMLWSKQYYSYDIERWAEEHGEDFSGRK
jgi:hypothetical protein